MQLKLPPDIVFRPQLKPIFPGSLGLKTKRLFIFCDESVLTDEFINKFIFACENKKKTYKGYQIFCACFNNDCLNNHNSDKYISAWRLKLYGNNSDQLDKDLKILKEKAEIDLKLEK